MTGNRLARFLRGKILPEQQGAFDREMAGSNAFAMAVFLPLVMGFELFNLCRVLFFSRSGLSTPNNRAYFACYVALFLASLAYFILVIHYRRGRNPRPRPLLGASAAYGAVVLLWGTAVTLLDLRGGDNISVYVVIVIAVAVFLYLRPWQSLLFFTVNHLALLALLPHVRPAGNLGLVINTTWVAVISLGMALTRYHNHAETLRSRWIITRQNEQIRRQNEQLARMVVTDPLTRLHNRRFLEEQMPVRWAEHMRAHSAVAVVMFDIDDFKLFNDTYGHPAGDRCLKRIAGVLMDCAGDPRDLLIRYGGEEFSVILFGRRPEEVLRLAERIRARVEALGIVNRASAHKKITLSGGVCFGSAGEAGGLDALFFRADEALYRAKREGKNRIVRVDGVGEVAPAQPQIQG